MQRLKKYYLLIDFLSGTSNDFRQSKSCSIKNFKIR
jgi:hypothetical protein